MVRVRNPLRSFQRNLVERYAAFLVSHPYVTVALVLLMVTVFSVLSFAPSAGAPDSPDFSDPTKGFEPRGTTISRRLWAFNNLKRALEFGWDRITLNPSKIKPNLTVIGSGNSRRTSREIAGDFKLLSQLMKCSSFYESFGNNPDTFVIYGGDNVFTKESLKAICRMDELYIRSTKEFSNSCERGGKTCCPTMSLGNFIAAVNQRASCQEITDRDVDKAYRDLTDCAELFFNGALKKCAQGDRCDVPDKCKLFSSVFAVFYYLADKNFLNRNENLRYTSAISPIRWWNTGLYENIYKESFSDLGALSQDDVRVEAFQFGNFRYDYFSEKLHEDTVYIALALVCVVTLVCLYTCSFFIGFLTVLNTIFASLMGYFFYHIAFGLHFFPFLNMTAVIFIVGISADDIFIYFDVWQEAKRLNPSATSKEWTKHSLLYAAKSMFVTSFTTSAAFYAVLISDITALKCFGVFAGTTVLCLFLLMVTWFPSLLVIYEEICKKCCCPDALESRVPREEPSRTVIVLSQQADEGHRNQRTLSLASEEVYQKTEPHCALQKILRKVKETIYGQFLPYIVGKLRYPLILIAVGLVSYFSTVVFFTPGLSIPTKKDLQLFKASHPLEQFNLKFREKFRFSSSGPDINTEGRTGYLVWGVKEVDNGNYLDADDQGYLEWDKPPDIFPPESQEWLLKLCRSMASQPFHKMDAKNACFMENFVKLMSNNCTKANFPCCIESKFPYGADIFEECLKRGDVYAHDITTKSGPVFDVKTGNVIALIIPLPTNATFSQEYQVNARFWKGITTWFNGMLKNAPRGLSNGWVTVSWLGFYDLQESLGDGTLFSVGVSVALAFVVILLTTLNLFISIFSLITIVSIIIVTIGSLTLLGWELNVLESMTMSIAAGLSVDFTVHYGVAYCCSVNTDSRLERVKYALEHIGSAVTVAALTTLCTGAVMTPSGVLAYYQMGLFLALVMFVSWFFATFLFLPLCAVLGPVNRSNQIPQRIETQV